MENRASLNNCYKRFLCLSSQSMLTLFPVFFLFKKVIYTSKKSDCCHPFLQFKKQSSSVYFYFCYYTIVVVCLVVLFIHIVLVVSFFFSLSFFPIQLTRKYTTFFCQIKTALEHCTFFSPVQNVVVKVEIKKV